MWSICFVSLFSLKSCDAYLGLVTGESVLDQIDNTAAVSKFIVVPEKRQHVISEIQSAPDGGKLQFNKGTFQ